MSNQIIKNKQPSILVLSPLQDAFGGDLTLRPRGMKGDEREITAETAADEIVARVKAAGWAEVVDIPSAPHAPAVIVVPPAPPEPPKAEEPPAPPEPPAPAVIVVPPAPPEPPKAEEPPAPPAPAVIVVPPAPAESTAPASSSDNKPKPRK